MIRLVAVILLPAPSFAAGAGRAADTTPVERFAQTHRIERGVGLLKRHFHITAYANVAARQ